MKYRFAILLAVLVMTAPSSARACEMCFGAAADSPTIQAIAASMLVLLVLATTVFGGVFSFFKKAHDRASELAADPPDTT